MEKKRRLLDEYQFPGFRPKADIHGVFGDSRVRIIRLERRQKKRYAEYAAQFTGVITTEGSGEFGIYPVECPVFTWRWRPGGYVAGNARK